ncbi:TrmH family RNA methyltransferase, partial [Streptosporangium sp. NPDC048865]
ALLEAADGVCYIPQVGRVGSFNVAVAAAIVVPAPPSPPRAPG